MSFEFSGYQQRSERFQQELEAPMEDVLGATAQQALRESPVQSIGRMNELAEAERSPLRVDAETARQRIKDAGLDGRLTVQDSGIAEPALDILIDRKREEVRRQDILSRAPKGFVSGAQQLGMAFAASVLDPLNVGLAFVPVVGEARYMKYLAGARGVLGRTAVRAGVGAAEGAAGAAIVEPLIYAAKSQEQADYEFQDSLLNVAFGTVFGGGLHVLGGVGSEVSRVMRDARAPKVADVPRMEPSTKLADIPDSAAARVDAMPLQEREAAMRTAVAQSMQGKAVDIESLIPKRQMDSPEFRQWFAESKVVDDAGEPMRVYKGMPANDWRDGSPIETIDSRNGPWAGFFTSKPEVANRFSERFADLTRNGGEPAMTVPAFVSMKRPYIIDAQGRPASDFQFDNLNASERNAELRAAIEGSDYDGVIVRNTANEGDIFVPKRPEQVKSAIGNSGRFDPNSASLTDAADRQSSPSSEVTADVPASQAADRQIAEMSTAPDAVAEQEALLADELKQLKEQAKVMEFDLGDELDEFDEAIKLADEYGKAARAAVLCGAAH
jgi:hypothetical protein